MTTHSLLSTWLSSEKEIPPHLRSALEKLSTEHISGIPTAQLDSPMMKQYRTAKEEVPDAILFFRMGDFYELFGTDAVIVSDICGLTLTSRDKTSDNPIPMAGTPVAGYKNSLKKCIQAGFKVAVCDQVEDPRSAKGIVKREITRIATPAVPGDLDDDESNSTRSHFGCYLASILGDSCSFTLAFVDVSTGEFRITSKLDTCDLIQELTTLRPKEILTSSTLHQHLKTLLNDVHFDKPPAINPIENWILRSQKNCEELFCAFFKGQDLHKFGISSVKYGLETVASLLHYLKSTQKNVLQNIKKITQYETKNYLIVDDATRKNLDFFHTSTGEKKGSLFHFLNRCATQTGSRLLLRRLNYPFKNKVDIENSLNTIEEFLQNNSLVHEASELLKDTADMDRILSRAAQKSLDARAIAWLGKTLLALEKMNTLCEEYPQAILFCNLIKTYNTHSALKRLSVLLENALVEDPAQQTGKGGVIFRTGYNAELDEAIALETNFNEKLEELEKFERERSQISTLKIGYTRVFGYYFEISKGKLASVPKHFMRKQTLTNGERFITSELKELEEKFLTSSERRIVIEKELLEELRIQILNFAQELTHASELIAQVDLNINFLKLASEYNWSKPTLVDKNVTLLNSCVHPILAFLNSSREPFIENDIALGKTDEHAETNPLVHLITGPNMAGKSTIMRQVAVCQILCQIGSFVPAQSATIGTADRILSRIGSADHALKNQSTFMVEMLETANMLRLATEKSLLLLDEVGRGTSTFDGLSLAWAILEHLHDVTGARTLFSTHYHELSSTCDAKKNIQPMQMMVLEKELPSENGTLKRDILFSRKYCKGFAEKSYGLHVAELAGLPSCIISRAQTLLQELEERKEKRGADAPEVNFYNKNNKFKKNLTKTQQDFTLF